MSTREWSAVTGVSVPLGLGSGTLSGTPVVATAPHVTSTLIRTAMFGSFAVYADPTGTSAYPVAGWETQLEAWVGLWSDSGDATLTVPGDPFDNPDPDPGWLSTAVMAPQMYPAVTPRHTVSAQLQLPPTGVWSHAQRRSRFAPLGNFQQVYFCWVFDAQSLPLPGQSSGGVDYKAGMNFWFRALWETA